MVQRRQRQQQPKENETLARPPVPTKEAVKHVRHDCSLLNASAPKPFVTSWIKPSSLDARTGGGAGAMRGALCPEANIIPFDGVRSTPSPPPPGAAMAALPALSLCTPPTGSRAFPAPLVHTPLGPGGARAPPRGGKSAGCSDTVGALEVWLRGPPLRGDDRVECSVGFGLRPTAQSGRGGSGCCEEVVREDEDVDDWFGVVM